MGWLFPHTCILYNLTHTHIPTHSQCDSLNHCLYFRKYGRTVIHCFSRGCTHNHTHARTHTHTHISSGPDAGLSTQLWCLTYTNTLSNTDQLQRWRPWWSKISSMEKSAVKSDHFLFPFSGSEFRDTICPHWPMNASVLPLLQVKLWTMLIIFSPQKKQHLFAFAFLKLFPNMNFMELNPIGKAPTRTNHCFFKLLPLRHLVILRLFSSSLSAFQ